MGILFELDKTSKAGVYVYSHKETHNFLNDIKGNFPREYKKLLQHISRLSVFGIIRDETKFKHIQNNLYELKANKLRVFCLIIPDATPKTFVLNHYYKKQKQKTPNRSLDKAQRIANEILEQLKSGALTIGD